MIYADSLKLKSLDSSDLEFKCRGFVEVLEALVKRTSEFQNPLVHTPIYSSTIIIVFTNFLWILICHVKLIIKMP